MTVELRGRSSAGKSWSKAQAKVDCLWKLFAFVHNIEK